MDANDSVGMGEEEKVASSGGITPTIILGVIFVIAVGSAIGFFAYKLVSSLRQKQRAKEEKKKLKQQRKEKEQQKKKKTK